MFNEDEDWNDEQEAQILSETVLKNTQKAKSSTNVKVVGKKSLLRTLQTLGSVPEWESSNHLQGSDSETETAPSHSKKKKRRKKRKHKGKPEEPQENGKVNHTVTEEKPSPKKRKKEKETGSTKSNKITAGEIKEKEITDSAQVKTNKAQSAEKISRQQWKNKMKNKRKCKNKYRQDKPEENVNKDETADKQEPWGEVKIDSQNDNNNNESIRQTTTQKRTERERKPLKKKNTVKGTPTPEEQQHKAENKTQRKEAEKSSDSSAVGSKQITGELQVKIPDDPQEVSVKRRKPELSKEQSLKRQKLRKIILSQETDYNASPAEQKDGPVSPVEVKQSGPDSFRARMEQRLESARFRYINEVLYSTTSGEAKRMFQQDPQAFWIYHKGYTTQVQRWPANPVDEIIAYIQTKSSSLVVADFGCGDCKIARSVKNKVHSFDLASTCDLVTVCDMANVPLGDGSVDIAVFCLSLMGTNLADFLAEANRVLRIGGVIKIAEVASRFDNVRNFISALASLGFKMVSKGTENTHFYSFEFKKTENAPKNIKKHGLQLKPCVYKKR